MALFDAYYPGSGCDVTAYRSSGMGFGVLSIFYAMADEYGVLVQDLVDAFQSGTGVGQLFQQFGKPSKLGVGYLRKTP